MGFWARRRDGSKYGNKPKRCAQGVMHQSTLEADQCNVLHALANAGMLSDLKAHPQPQYKLDVNGVHICDYRPDFEFMWAETGELRTIDTKGVFTDASRIKCALFRALYGREVEIVRRPWRVGG